MKYMSVTTAILSLFFFGTSVQADQLQCNSIEETERAIIKLKKDPLLLQFGCHGEIEVWRISNATSTTFTYGYEHYLKTKVDGSLMFVGRCSGNDRGGGLKSVPPCRFRGLGL
jgi:hypothetical protein